MYCIYCGQELPSDAKFCSACGKVVVISDSLILTNDLLEQTSIYNFIRIGEIEFAIGFLNGKYGLFECPNRFVSRCVYEDMLLPKIIYSNKNDLIYFVKMYGKWGVRKYPNEEVFPCIFEDVVVPDLSWIDCEHLWYHLKKNGKWCFYEAPTIEIQPFIFDDIKVMGTDPSRSWVLDYGYKFRIKKKYGLYFYPDKEIFPCIYDDLDTIIDESSFKVKIKGKCGILDENRNELFPFIFDDIIDSCIFKEKKCGFEDGHYFEKEKERCYLLVKNNNELGVYEYLQNLVIPFGRYEGIEILNAPYLIVTKNDKKGLLNECREVLACEYDEIKACSLFYGDYWEDELEYYILTKNGKYGYFDKKCTMPCIYDKIDIISNYGKIYCIIKINNQYGVYSDAIELIPPLYDKITSEHFEYESHHVTIYTATGIGFIVKQHNKVGAFIYNDSVEIIPCLYDDVDFKNYPIIRVKHEGKWLSFNDFDEFKNHISFCNESVNNSKPDNISDKFLDELFKNLDDNLSSNVFTINNSNANNNIVKDYLPYYLFFDTETTGVPKNYKAPITDLDNWPRLVQLGWILCDDNGNEIETGNDIIKPNGFIIPKAASNVHKITTSMAIANGIDLSQALSKFILASKQAKVLVGHNVSFDINVVGAELLRIQSDYNIVSKASIDTMLKSINYCAIPSGFSYGDKYKWPKLQELHKKLFGYEFEDAHDAMADIRATKKCFFEMKRIGLIIEESRTLDKHPINNSASIDDIPGDDLPF